MLKSLALLHTKVLTFAIGALFVLTSASGVYQAVSQGEAKEQQQTSQQEAHFWRVVAGEDAGASPGPGNLLARDIRAYQGDLSDFRGSSNRYGGVTDAIGFDPFDESGLGCFECGPLDAQTIHNIELIEDGKLDEVIITNEFTEVDETINLTPFGLPNILWFGGLYLILGSTSALASHHNLKNNVFTRSYGAEEWAFNGKQSDVKLYLLLTAPLYTIPKMIASRQITSEFSRKMKQMFPEHVQVVQEVDRELESAPDNETTRSLREKRDAVVRELEAQTSSSGGTEDIEASILLDQLHSAAEFLEARRYAKAEIEQKSRE